MLTNLKQNYIKENSYMNTDFAGKMEFGRINYTMKKSGEDPLKEKY